MPTTQFADDPADSERHQRLWDIALSTAACSHDLSNWLMMALSTLDLATLRHDALGTELALSRFAIEQAIELLREALQGQVAAVQRCDVAAAVTLVLQVVQMHIQVRGNLVLASEIQATPHVAMAAADLRRVLLNLILNAVAAMPAGGTISVVVEASAGHVQIDIRDSGSGIGDDQAGGAFQVFAARRVGGTGLGLPGSELLVQRAGGRLSLMSQSGGGTLATLILPLSDQAGL